MEPARLEKLDETVSQIDIAPTIAEALGIRMPGMDGRALDLDGLEPDGGFSRAVLIIVDSLGYDLYRHLEPDLLALPALVGSGRLFRARAVTTHTSPAIASILSGLLPEHHNIWNTEDAKGSGLKSIPEVATAGGVRTAVVMEKEGAEVYRGLIDFIGGVDRTLDPHEFDRQILEKSLQALSSGAGLLVSYFIGIDKAAHNGLGMKGIREALVEIDCHIGAIRDAAGPWSLIIICGDHPVHAGDLKRTRPPYCVAMIAAATGS